MGEPTIEHAYRFCPRCGEANANLGSIPFRCQSCGYAQFFGPVAAVGGLIVNDAGELLMVRRAKDPQKGRLGLPGGFIDRGETVEEALRREILEETSLVPSRCEYLLSFPNRYVYCGVEAPVTDLFFLCTVDDRQQIRLDPTELSEFFWVRPDTEVLDQMAFESNRKAIEHWLDS